MSQAQKIGAVMAELGHRDFDLIWLTSPRGKAHSFAVTFRGATVHGCTVRALIRAVRRHLTTASRACVTKT